MLTKYEHYTTGLDAGASIYGATWRGESFTPLISHKIHSVKLWLGIWKGLPGTVIVGIRATDADGFPVGADLCSGSIDGNTLSQIVYGNDYEKREIVFDIDYPLIAGVKYAKVVRAPDGDSENSALWGYDSTSATYAAGAFLTSSDFGRSWKQYPTIDFLFEEWGFPMPELPTFAPGEIKTAVAPIRVKPSGLGCEAEIYLGPDDMTKLATSGRIPFTSTGYSQDIHLPIAMPATEGTYHIFIDVYAEGYLIAAYQAIDDVVIAAPVAEFAYVSDIKRGYYSYSYDYFAVDVQNVSNIAGTCTLEFHTRVNQRVPFGWTDWVLGATVSHTLQPGEIRTFGDGKECLMRAYFKNNVLRMSVKFVGEPGEIIWEHGAWA